MPDVGEKTIRLSPQVCPHCGHAIDATTGWGHETGPAPGDISVCMYCAELVAFDENLNFRVLAYDELVAIMTEHPEIDRLRRTLTAITAGLL